MPGVPRHVPGRSSLHCLLLLCGLSCLVPRCVFPAAALAAVRTLCRRWARVLHLSSRPACLAACAFARTFMPAALFARSVPCAPGFSLWFLPSFPLCLTFSSQISFHLSLKSGLGFAFCPHPAALFSVSHAASAFVPGPRRWGSDYRLPAMCFIARIYSFIFCLFLPNFFLSKFFSLVAQAATGLYFLPKKSRQRFAVQLRPFEPHSCALRPIFSSSALLVGQPGPLAQNRRLGRQRLKSPGAELSFSSVSVREGNACALSITPFLAAGGLAALRLQIAGWGMAALKPKEQSSAFRAFLCVGVRLAPRFTYSWKFSGGLSPGGFLPGRREQEAGFLFARKNRSPHPETTAGVRGWAQTQTRCVNCSAQPRQEAGSPVMSANASLATPASTMTRMGFHLAQRSSAKPAARSSTMLQSVPASEMRGPSPRRP